MLVKIVNSTKGSVIAEEAELANTILTRMKGLLGRKSLPAGQGIVLEPCKQIHSWFMQFTFDAVFISKKGKVVYLMQGMPRFKTTPYIRKAWQVIELPAGTINTTKTQINDQIQITV